MSIPDDEFNAAIDVLLSRYAGALDQMAKGVMPHESDIGPAIEAIRKELTTLRAKLSAAEGREEDFRKMVLAMHAAAMGEVVGPRRGLVQDVADLRARLSAAEAQGEAMRNVLRDLATIMDGRDTCEWCNADFIQCDHAPRCAVAIARRALEGAKGI